MVSVIIPTYNAAFYLPKLISALNKQTVNYELIIIDSESTDNTHSILKKLGIEYTIIPKKEFNHGETRNKGVELSNCEIVIFLTQDAIPASDDTLEILADSFLANDYVAMAYGRQLPYPDTDVFGKFARYNNYPPQSVIKDKAMIPELGIKTCSCSNSFAAYRKSTFREVGGFPKDTILGEDVTVAAKLILKDYSVAYNAEASVFHSHTYSIVEEFRRYFDIGVFHNQQKTLLKAFSNAESEGIRYVLQESNYLIKEGKAWLLPIQYLRTIAKYAGYRIGYMYKKLPSQLNRSLSMHRLFW